MNSTAFPQLSEARKKELIQMLALLETNVRDPAVVNQWVDTLSPLEVDFVFNLLMKRESMRRIMRGDKSQ